MPALRGTSPRSPHGCSVGGRAGGRREHGHVLADLDRRACVGAAGSLCLVMTLTAPGIIGLHGVSLNSVSIIRG